MESHWNILIPHPSTRSSIASRKDVLGSWTSPKTSSLQVLSGCKTGTTKRMSDWIVLVYARCSRTMVGLNTGSRQVIDLDNFSELVIKVDDLSGQLIAVDRHSVNILALLGFRTFLSISFSQCSTTYHCGSPARPDSALLTFVYIKLFCPVCSKGLWTFRSHALSFRESAWERNVPVPFKAIV